MASSTHISKSLDKYSELFQCSSKMPVHWDVKNKRIVFISKTKDLIIWYRNLTVLLCMCICCSFLVLRSLFVPKKFIPLWVLLVQLGLGVFGTLAFGISFALMFYGRSASPAWNQLVEMLKIIQKGNAIFKLREI